MRPRATNGGAGRCLYNLATLAFRRDGQPIVALRKTGTNFLVTRTQTGWSTPVPSPGLYLFSSTNGILYAKVNAETLALSRDDGATWSNVSLPLGNAAFSVDLPHLYRTGSLRYFSCYPGEVCRVYRIEGL
jgi:hypothetical protein